MMALIPRTTTIAAQRAAAQQAAAQQAAAQQAAAQQAAAQQAAAQARTLPTAQPLQAVPAATEGLLPAPATTPTPAPASTGGIYDGIWNNPDVWTQTGPGGGLLSAITPIQVSGAANTYPTNDQWLMAMAKPAGQSFSAAGYDGDSTFTMGADNSIRVTDLSGNVLYEGTGYDGAQAASDLTSSIVGDAGSMGYRVEGLDPYSGEWQSLAYNARPADGMGMFMDYVLPAVGAIALPGFGGVLGGALGTGLGAAGGSIASSVAQGRALDDALMRAGISGLTAGGLSALSGTPIIPETGGAIPISPEVAQNLANVAIPQVATSQQIAASLPASISGAAPSIAPTVINVTAPALATTPVSGALGAAAGSSASSIASNLTQPSPAPEPAVPEDAIVVQAQTPTPTPVAPVVPAPSLLPSPSPAPEPAVPEDAIVVQAQTPTPTPVAPVVPAPSLLPSPSPAPEPAVPEGEIVVEAETPTPTPVAPVVPAPSLLPPPSPAPEPAVPEGEIVVEAETPTPTPVAPVVPPPPVPTINAPASEIATETPPETVEEAQTDSEQPPGNSLLDEIIKYYTLGSFGLDALGGLLGGSGSGGTTTPYVSQLGAMPTFARGGYQPYTGDYETYGFGPEFNFFGGPATMTTGPGQAASLLNPALPVNNTVVA
jgi:hypothetical protein